jgi:hypothetical protein
MAVPLGQENATINAVMAQSEKDLPRAQPSILTGKVSVL